MNTASPTPNDDLTALAALSFLQKATRRRVDVPKKERARDGVRQDWSQIVTFRPELTYQPKSVAEIKAILTSIATGKVKATGIRVLGSLHSCSDICVSDAVIDVSQMPKKIAFTPGNTAVTVSANWVLHDFLLALSKKGKSLTATGGTDEQTLAGVVSTNTAPATSRYSIFELLEWLEYVTIDPVSGAVVEKRLTRGDKAFRAAAASLGAIGVVVRLHFRLEDERFFSTVQRVVKLDEVLKDLKETAAKYDFWRIAWLPGKGSQQGLLWTATSIKKSEADPNGDYGKDHAEGFLKALFKFWDTISLGSAGPLLDGVMRAIYTVMAAVYNFDKPKANGPLRNMLPVDRGVPLHIAMAEWSFHPDKLCDVMDICRAYFDRKGWPNLPIEIELTRTDDFYMSPWNWEKTKFIVKFNFMYLTDICRKPAEKQALRDHLHGLWKEIEKARIPFKAHWGKINFMDRKFVAKNYQVKEFRKFVHPLFVNPYLRDRI